MRRLCVCAALVGSLGWAAAAAPVSDAAGRGEPAGMQWTARTVLSATGLFAAEGRESSASGALGTVLQPVVGVAEDSVTRRADLPEPAAFALIGSALLALGVIRKRRHI